MAGRVGNRFGTPFRRRPAWRTDALGATALWQPDPAAPRRAEG